MSFMKGFSGYEYVYIYYLYYVLFWICVDIN